MKEKEHEKKQKEKADRNVEKRELASKKDKLVLKMKRLAEEKEQHVKLKAIKESVESIHSDPIKVLKKCVKMIQ